MPNTITGGAGSDTLNGLSGDNLISGGDGADKLNGGASLDTLDGGAGSDTISGNSGDDLLVFDARTPAGTLDVYDGGSGKDTLKLVLTFDQWFSASVQAELASHLNFVLVNTQWRTLEANNTEFSFTSLGVGLRTSKIEYLKVVAGGVDVGDATDEAVTLAADSATVTENTSGVSMNVLANDLVPDMVKTLTFTQPGNYPAKGGVILEGGPFVAGSTAAWLKYTPVAGAWGFLAAGATATETFNYTVVDADGDTDTKSVIVNITGVNDGPVAVADTAAGGENQTLTIDVLANDTDADDGHVFTLLSGAAPAGKGSASVVAGKLVFDPGTAFDHLKAGATEVVTLNYQMKDDQGATSSSTVAVTITGVNDGPVAIADTAAGGENQTLTIDVLANDTDVDDDHVFTLLNGSAPAGKGSVSVAANQLVFDPGTDFDHLKAGATEVVTLNYQMKDDQGATSSSTVSVTVTGVNDGPVAVADAGSATEAGTAAGSDATGDVLANDTDVDVADTKTVSLVKFGGVTGVVGSELSGAYGKLTLDADGSYGYVVDNANPAVDALRLPTDTLVEVFTYRVKDGSGAESEATLTITIHGANDAAVFTSGATGGVAENAPISTVVYDAAVTDVDGLAPVFSLSGADAGLFDINASTGEVTFKVSPNFEAPGDVGGNNVYDIDVKAFDGQATTTRSVAITVSNVNEAPSITSNGGGATAGVSVAENTSAVTTVTATDPDAATTLTYSIIGGVDQAKFSIDPNTGALAFVAPPNFEAPTDSGLDNTYEVQVKASDGALDDVQTITVTVTDLQENAAPTAVADTVIMSAGTNPAIFLASALLANDTDPELDALQVVGAAGSGVSFNAGTGLITLTDPTITSFTYQMKDATHAAVTGTVTVQKVTIGSGNTNDTVNISGFTYAASYIDAANGADSVTGGGGVNWFLGGSGADVMVGSGANDTLSGEQDNDRLTGNAGADNLLGGAGADTLTGGAGDDLLRGDNGTDRFVFTSLGDGADTIQDFALSTTSQPDRIDLSAIDAVPGGADNAFAFVAVQNAGTVANSVTWQITGGVTLVRIDTDGVAGAELTITLAGAPSLTSADFIL